MYLQILTEPTNSTGSSNILDIKTRTKQEVNIVKVWRYESVTYLATLIIYRVLKALF